MTLCRILYKFEALLFNPAKIIKEIT